MEPRSTKQTHILRISGNSASKKVLVDGVYVLEPYEALPKMDIDVEYSSH